MGQSQPSDGSAVQNYTQQYAYDAAGNILSLQHVAGTGSYTRTYAVDTASNKLLGTTVGSNTYSYTHDARGNMLTMPHLQNMGWNALNELYTITQGTTVASYQYSGGQRVRKYVDKGSIKEERIYLGSYEIYRKFDHTGSLTIERTTVHVSDDTGRIAMLETRTHGNAGDDNNTAETLTRYIYSNHLQSASLELDANAAIISYEEYHPYGTTSYQANNAAINAVAKRYRYTGKERDEESGLYYHGARYYIPWLARWSASDPLESKYAGMSPYNYGFNNPVKWIDSTGMAPDDIVTDTEKPKKPPKLDPPKPKEEDAKKAIELNPVEIKGDKLTSTESKASAAAMGLGLVLSEEVIGAIAAIFSEIIIPALIIVAIAYVLYRLFKEYLPHEKIWTKDETGTGEGTSTAEGTETDGGEGEEEQPMPSPNPDKPYRPIVPPPDEQEKKYEIFYRAMSWEEYDSRNGELEQRTNSDGTLFGEGPYVTDRLSYAEKALYKFADASNYDIIVGYMVPVGTKDYLKSVSLDRHTPDRVAAEKGLPIKKREDGDYNFKFPGNTADTHFNPRIISKSIIQVKNKRR